MFGSKLEVKRFEKDVLKYEARPVETGKILLYGDSLFTRSSFIYCDRHPEKGHPLFEEEICMKDGSKALLNHAFGTSSADDLLYYYDRLVRPYAPRALVLSTGGNDIGFGYSPAEVMNILATVIDWFQAEFSGAPVFCIKKMPGLASVGKETYNTRHRKAFGEILEAYVKEKEGVRLIDQWKMPFYFANEEDIGDRHKVRPEIYDTDGGHFNALGYRLFIDYMKDVFEKEGLL